MATFPTHTMSGGGPISWVVSGGNITNHEAFAFTLQSAPPNVGAYLSDVTVYLNTSYYANTTSYFVTVTAKNQNFGASTATITGNFESNEV